MDYQASTPVDHRVIEAMAPYWADMYGNPHSAEHAFGWEADLAIENARLNIGNLIGADSDEIVFTSGATESNNLAILGISRAAPPTHRHIIVSSIEHKCVLAAARVATREGMDVTVLPVDGDGLVSPDAVAAAITERTALVSVMLVNNEIGTVQPIEEISEICRSADVMLHTDAAQGLAVMPIDVARLGVDLMSLSGHKAYGPKGIGALYVRRGSKIRPQPIIHGGGQEDGLRSGTLPTPLCVGFGTACSILAEGMTTESATLYRLREHFFEKLRAAVPGIALNGASASRHPGNLNLRFPHVQADILLNQLQPDLAASSGSACSSGIPEPSHVLSAIGLSPVEAAESIRISLGRRTTLEEVDEAILLICAALERISMGS